MKALRLGLPARSCQLLRSSWAPKLLAALEQYTYSRLQKVGIWIWDGLGVGGRSYSKFMASTV